MKTSQKASDSTAPDAAPDRVSEVAHAAKVLREEAATLEAVASRLGESFCEAVDLVVSCAQSGGTVLVTGLGKSGLVGAKISATMASLGLPSHSVHPSEAAHGDLGRFRKADLCLALSYSGETEEVVNLAAILHQDVLPIVSITRGSEAGAQPSSLQRVSTVTLALGDIVEAGHPDAVAPTCTTTATMAVGDALALVSARRLNLTHEDFAKRHPGGALGGLLRGVTEVLRFRAGDNLPLISESATVRDALIEAGSLGRRPGAILIIEDGSGKLAGIFTDGDVRRLVLRDPRELDTPIGEVMTRAPRAILHTSRVRDAVLAFREQRQDEIPVVDEQHRPVGIIDVQDLIAMKLVRD